MQYGMPSFQILTKMLSTLSAKQKLKKKYLFCLLRFASRFNFFLWAYFMVSAVGEHLCRATAMKCRSMTTICCDSRVTDRVDDASFDRHSYCSRIRDCKQLNSSASPAMMSVHTYGSNSHSCASIIRT